jgi:hypothetical protein
MKDRAYVQSLQSDFQVDLQFAFEAVDDYHVRYIASTADDGRYIVVVSRDSDYPTHDDWFCSVYNDEDAYTNADAPIAEYRHETHTIDDILSIFS